MTSKDTNNNQFSMELRVPKKKRKVTLRKQEPFPIDYDCTNEWTIYTGHITCLGVNVVQPCEIETLHSQGFFGKGSLSRSFPNFERRKRDGHTVIRNRQWKRRLEWFQDAAELDAESLGDELNHGGWNDEEPLDSTGNEEIIKSPESHQVDGNNGELDGTKNEQKDVEELNVEDYDNKRIQGTTEDKESRGQNNDVHEVIIDSTKEDDESEQGDRDKTEDGELQVKELIILADSDSDTESYLANVKPQIEKERFPITETLHLTFEEAFFLMFGLGCLEILDFDSNVLDISSAWNHFCDMQKDFVQKYVVYHYFRSKGWVVKPGLKYGGDFLLYKQGPPFYHASYIVIVEVTDSESLIRHQTNVRKMTWEKLFGLDRLSESAAKEILFAEVLWPSTIPKYPAFVTPDMLGQFTVKELLYRRWVPRQQRGEIDVEDETINTC